MRLILLAIMTLFASCDLCHAQQPTVALITQEVCPPCKPAKKLFEKLRLEGAFDGCDAKEMDKDDPVVKSLGVRILTPMLVLLEGGRLKKSVNTVDTAHINAFLEDLPIEPREPMELDVDKLLSESTMFEATPTAAPPRIIRYTIATQYRSGTTYQGTFLWGDVDRCLNFLGRYWNIQFVRANSGTLNIVQANYQISTPSAFAWTQGTTIYISPVANYQRSLALTMKVLLHEFGHAAGGGSHNPDPRALMSTNTGTANCIIESDANWFRAYQWKGTLRPWHEPSYMKDWWTGGVRAATQQDESWSIVKEPFVAKRTRQWKHVEDPLHVAP
jgi:hypothetical protein